MRDLSQCRRTEVLIEGVWVPAIWEQIDKGDTVRFLPVNETDVTANPDEHFIVSSMPAVRVDTLPNNTKQTKETAMPVNTCTMFVVYSNDRQASIGDVQFVQRQIAAFGDSRAILLYDPKIHQVGVLHPDREYMNRIVAACSDVLAAGVCRATTYTGDNSFIDYTKTNPSLHLLYTKWATVHLQAIDEAIAKLNAFNNSMLHDALCALSIERDRLVRDNAAYRDADEIFRMLEVRSQEVAPRDAVLGDKAVADKL